jgi:hypothetical protein
MVYIDRLIMVGGAKPRPQCELLTPHLIKQCTKLSKSFQANQDLNMKQTQVLLLGVFFSSKIELFSSIFEESYLKFTIHPIFLNWFTLHLHKGSV